MPDISNRSAFYWQIWKIPVFVCLCVCVCSPFFFLVFFLVAAFACFEFVGTNLFVVPLSIFLMLRVHKSNY